MSEAVKNALAKHHEAVIAEGIEAINEYVRDHRLPLALLEGLRRYLQDRIPTGSFLWAVLENDLARAIGSMHGTLAVADLRELLDLLRNSFPSMSYGSPEKVAAWLERGDGE